MTNEEIKQEITQIGQRVAIERAHVESPHISVRGYVPQSVKDRQFLFDHLRKTIKTQAEEIRLLREVAERAQIYDVEGIGEDLYEKARAALSAFDSTRDKEHA